MLLSPSRPASPGGWASRIGRRSSSQSSLGSGGIRGMLPRESRLRGMCRNIRTLYNFDPPATDEEIHAAAEQYVRKISGFSKASQANAQAFARAVEEVAEA